MNKHVCAWSGMDMSISENYNAKYLTTIYVSKLNSPLTIIYYRFVNITHQV